MVNQNFILLLQLKIYNLNSKISTDTRDGHGVRLFNSDPDPKLYIFQKPESKWESDLKFSSLALIFLKFGIFFGAVLG